MRTRFTVPVFLFALLFCAYAEPLLTLPTASPQWGAPAPMFDRKFALATTAESLYVFDFAGNIAVNFPVHCGGAVTSKIAWNYIDGDSHSAMLVTLAENGVLMRYDMHASGEIEHRFTVDLGAGQKYISPLIFDCDRDGTDEIYAAVDSYLVRVSEAGVVQWSARLSSSTGFAVSTPAIGDIDGDGFYEVVVTGYNCIDAFKCDGAVCEGFPFVLESGQAMSYSSPITFDYDRDGADEIYCGGFYNISGEHGFFLALEGGGSSIGSPFYLISTFGSWIYASLSSGDVNGDHIPDLVACTVTGTVIAVDYRRIVTSFGGVGLDHAGRIYSSALLCDIDTAAGAEYVFPISIVEDSLIQFIVIEADDDDISGFPDTISGEGEQGIGTAAALIDGDSTLIIFAAPSGAVHGYAFYHVVEAGYTNWLELFGDRFCSGRVLPAPPDAKIYYHRWGYEISWAKSTFVGFGAYRLYAATDSLARSATLLARISARADTVFELHSAIPAESMWVFLVLEDFVGRTSIRSHPRADLDTTDIAEPISNLSISALDIVPNPFNSVCEISAPALCEIEVFDISGTLVGRVSNRSRTFDASHLPSGTLVFRAIDASGRTVAVRKALLIK